MQQITFKQSIILNSWLAKGDRDGECENVSGIDAIRASREGCWGVRHEMHRAGGRQGGRRHHRGGRQAAVAAVSPTVGGNVAPALWHSPRGVLQTQRSFVTTAF